MTPAAKSALDSIEDALRDLRAELVVTPAVPAAARLLTTPDLAQRYSVSNATARGWLAGGHVTGARRLGRLGWRWEPSGLVALDIYLAWSDATNLSAWRKTKVA